MQRLSIVVFVLLLCGGCQERESVITIVDIGRNNRLEIGKQLRIINQFSPKIVALDFFLVPDSLSQDTILVKELNRITNSVQVVALHDFNEPLDCWDSLEISHSKFTISNYGFANITTTEEDTTFVRELPLKQCFNGKWVYSFSYVVAENSFGVKTKYRNSGTTGIKFDLSNIGNYFNIISREDLDNGEFNKSDFDGKIVILGYIGNDDDHFKVDGLGQMSINGVIIQAAIINEIIDL